MRARNAPKRRPPKAVRVKRVRKFPEVSPLTYTDPMPLRYSEVGMIPAESDWCGRVGYVFRRRAIKC